MLRFIADAMVGRLATWLRLLGHDVAYQNHIPDPELIGRARRERRIVLTRDRDVVRRCGARALFIKSQHVRDQVRQVTRRYRLKRTLFSRCSFCNVPPRPAAKSRLAKEVPPQAYAAYQKFWRCPRCRKVYWRGSHQTLFRKDLKLASALFNRR